MFNLQGSEIIFILLLALVVLGPEKLPGAIRRFTRTYAELRKMGNSFQDEVKTAFDEPMREVRETADLLRKQVDVNSLEAEHDAAEAAAAEAAAAERAANDGVGQGQHPDTAYRPLQPPVAGTARPGPERDPHAPPAPRTPKPTVPPPPPAPFAASHPVAPAPAPVPAEPGSTDDVPESEEESS